MRNPLPFIKSRHPLYILHLASGKAEIYDVGARGASLVQLQGGLEQAQDLAEWATQLPNKPWVILVDQSEETFWGGVMPFMRGKARSVWIDRMSEQSGMDSPYRWSDMQGKSRNQSDKMRVLGYTLGRPESVTPWLDALHTCEVRIRGVYSPVMLTPAAIALLKVKPLKSEESIGVLVTPHAEGLRQTVLAGGRVRFSRLALHPPTVGVSWFATVYQETARLREYLIGNGQLKNDRAGMSLYTVLPEHTRPAQAIGADTQHARDQYHWIDSPLTHLVYVAALAKQQPALQLAPLPYIKRDQSIRATSATYIGAAIVAACAMLYLALGASQLWQKQVDIDTSTRAHNRASQQYLAIAKTYPITPLTAAQLTEMASRWQGIEASTLPSMRPILVAAGQVLERHPGMVIDELQWATEAPHSATTHPAAGTPPTPAKDNKVSSTLSMRGTIRGIASTDLRGTRDALARFLADLNRQPNLRAEITKKPLDLSTKAALSGSSRQEKSELNFEVKLWQR
ncbi:MAG: hypothetical protein QM533_10820 [Cytophagales bacterium]|nr:hypothetical protein [Cytophagales bacterium]